jgi:hypothetical protein
VRNRIYTSRTGQVDQIDARWLLQLAEIGAEAIAELQVTSTAAERRHRRISHQDIIDRWNGAIS